MHYPESPLQRLFNNVVQHMQPSCTPLAETPQSHHSFDARLLLSQAPRTPTSTHPPEATRPLSPAIFQQLSVALNAAHELREACVATGRVTDEGTLTMSEVWDAAHAEQTRAWAEDAISRARAAVAMAKPSSAELPLKAKKPVFNYEYTPLLEKYFEYNAYPSALDRTVLARKSMMTSRQIEVWFQNHRNRARKDGKPLRKLAEDPLPVNISLSSLGRKMPFFTIPEHERKPVTKPEHSKDDSPDEDDVPLMPMPCGSPTPPDVLNPPRPCHAFPTPYPPPCNYDPFPTKLGIHKFPPPVWFRKPAISSCASRTAVDMEDFIKYFNMKLHLRAPLTKKRRSKLAQSWCTSRTTILPPAPHPALVRSFIPSPSTHLPPFPIVVAPSSRSHPFRPPGAFSKPITLIPSRTSNNTPVRRKVAHLPKRIPKGTTVADRHDSPAISQASLASSRSSSITSRSTSFGSQMSTDRRPSSSSSCSSSSSSAPATPELSHATLPDDGRSPSVSVSGVDFDNMDGLFGNNRPSSEEVMPFTFSVTAQSKDPFAFGFKVPAASRSQSENSPFRSYAPDS